LERQTPARPAAGHTADVPDVISAGLALAPCLLPVSAMSRARQVLRKRFYLITRRCTQRQFYLRPDSETNNAFIYCLVEAALRCKIQIVLTVAQANHHHTVIYDRYGNYPRFLEHFHKMFACCQNARLGRWENLWSNGEPGVTELLDRATVLEKLVYVATNPVKDNLVERATQWPGTNGYVHLLAGRPLVARRPRYFFHANGSMPAEVSMPLVIPDALGPAEAIIAELRERVAAVELKMREYRAQTGKRIVGRRQVLKQSWHAAPTSREPRRTLRPRFAGTPEIRVSALLAYREFLADYRSARRAWIAGETAMFPPGTYWLAQFAPISVAPPPAD
jgi:REP element-mobilizing transposase RayT